MIPVILFLVYALSVIAMYFITRYNYHNAWKGINPDLTDVFMMLYPVINTVIALWMVVENYMENPSRKKRHTLKKFFRIGD